MPKKSVLSLLGKFGDWMKGKATAIEAFDWLFDHGYIIWWSNESQRIFVRRSKRSEPFRIPPSIPLNLQKELYINSREKLVTLKEERFTRVSFKR